MRTLVDELDHGDILSPFRVRPSGGFADLLLLDNLG
jgi:hypothetical protein